MILNGGFVAADIGLLAPEELQINFDERGGTLLTCAPTRRWSSDAS